MFPRKMLTFKASEITGNAFIFINPHEKILSNINRGGPRIFFRRGCTCLLLYFNTNKPHSFFVCRIPVVLENRRSSRGGGGGGGGVRTPCTLLLDPPLINHHSVSFLHKNAVHLTKKIVCAFHAKIISTFVNAKRYYDVRLSWPGCLEVV